MENSPRANRKSASATGTATLPHEQTYSSSSSPLPKTVHLRPRSAKGGAAAAASPSQTRSPDVTTEMGGSSGPRSDSKPIARSRANVSLFLRLLFEMMTIFFFRRCSSLTASTAPSYAVLPSWMTPN